MCVCLDLNLLPINQMEWSAIPASPNLMLFFNKGSSKGAICFKNLCDVYGRMLCFILILSTE